MNGNKGEGKETMLCCCGRGKQSLYLGVILFIIGAMLQSNLSIGQIVEMVGALVVITSLISILINKEK